MDFERVFKAYFKDVFLYVRSLSAEEGLAEEITQETFVKALKAIDSFDGKKDIRAWLFAIARNTYYSYLRQQKKLADEPLDDHAQFDHTDFTMRFVDEERAFLVHQFLHGVKEPYKEVFNLRVFGELSFEKIGRIFGKSTGWARVTYYRAKQQMIDYMEVIDNEDTPL